MPIHRVSNLSFRKKNTLKRSVKLFSRRIVSFCFFFVSFFTLLKNAYSITCFCREFKAMDDELLAPITAALKPLADVRVESQVIIVHYFPLFHFNCF